MLADLLLSWNAPLPLLVTGITGVAGYNALHYLRRRYPGQVFGIRPQLTYQFTGDSVIAQDADDAAGMRALFRHYRFRSVLNTTGNCALRACELNPDMARRINVTSAELMADNVRKFGCRLVHLSSDLVFSGTGGGNHVETDPIDPVTVYGKTMVQAERIIATAIPGAAILRISLPMGPSFNRHAGAIDWIDYRFRNHRPATLYYDEIRSATYCDDLNPVFEWFLSNEANGVFHLGGPRALALYQIGQIINRTGGYDPKLVNGCPRILAGPIPPRAGNVAMCSDKLIAALGCQPFRPWPADSELLPTDRQWHCQRQLGEQRSMQHIVEWLYHYGPEFVAVSPYRIGYNGSSVNNCPGEYLGNS